MVVLLPSEVNDTSLLPSFETLLTTKLSELVKVTFCSRYNLREPFVKVSPDTILLGKSMMSLESTVEFVNVTASASKLLEISVRPKIFPSI